MKVAIHKDPNIKLHSAYWTTEWGNFCTNNTIDYQYVNCYDSNIIEQLKNFDVLLWHFSGYLFKDMLIAKDILFSAKKMGLKVFPDFDDCWHFDDKIAETYLLQSIDAPLPKSFMYYSLEDLKNALNILSFPIIAKLRNGSGSHNVKLIKDKSALEKYAQQMFSKGFNSSPSLLYKTSSNIKSSKSLKVFYNRAKRIPEFLKTLAAAKVFPNEKGYLYLQEFIPNNGFDLKVVVIGDKLSFIGRNIREGDFRASGGGDLFYDRKFITKNVIDSAFRTNDLLGFKCMGYDYVVNKETGEGIIIEISYGFSHEALLLAKGYFDRDGNWYEKPLNAPVEILNNLIK
jgi:glutathione synthase/RimK-type ligase-like ATP-grasp enzyme